MKKSEICDTCDECIDIINRLDCPPNRLAACTSIYHRMIKKEGRTLEEGVTVLTKLFAFSEKLEEARERSRV